MSKVGKNFAGNFLDHFATWALLHWPSLSHGTVGCWSSVLCCCPYPTDTTTAIKAILPMRAGWTGRLSELLGKDIKSIIRDLIPSVVLPKLSLSWLNIAIALSSSGWGSLRLIAAGLKLIIHSLLLILKRGKIISLMILWRIKEIAYKIGMHCWSSLNIYNCLAARHYKNPKSRSERHIFFLWSPDLPLTGAGRDLRTAEPSLLTAPHGSTGGRLLRRDLPPALGQGGHGFVQPTPEISRRKSSTFLWTFLCWNPFSQQVLGLSFCPFNGILILCFDETPHWSFTWVGGAPWALLVTYRRWLRL